MLFQGVIFVLYLVNSSYGLTYDDLARDECFKKIYVCGDYRFSITGGTGRLVTEPYRFGEVCRRHKEFIACIEDAAHFCAGNFSDLALMILDNRRSVKMFCTDLEWKKNYFQSAACINKREQEVRDKCRIEEDERIDDRPWWCLIPEPCEAIQRVFECTVRKMEERCGSIAAEVFRRFHLLKVENQDVVCELRIRNPRYCRYQITKAPSLKDEKVPQESIRRIGYVNPQTSEALNDLIMTTIIDSINLLKKIKPLSLKIEDLKPFVMKNLLSINYKLKKLLSGFDLLHEFTSFHSKDFTDKESSEYKAENSEKMKTRIIKDSIYKLYKLFNDNKDLILIGEDHMELSIKEMEEFPVDHMSCFWLKSSQNSFKCEVKLMPLKQVNKMGTKNSDLWEYFPNISSAEDLEELLNFEDFKSSLMDESKQIRSKTGMDPLVFVSIDDETFLSNLNYTDIHRSGLQLENIDEEQIEDIYDSEEVYTVNTMDSISKNIKQELKDELQPPKQCDECSDSFKKLNEKSSRYTIPTINNFEQEFQNEDIQLQQLEDVLNHRFQNVDIVSNIQDLKSSDSIYSKNINENLSQAPSLNMCLENLYSTECKTNINYNMATLNSNEEIKLNRNEILLEFLDNFEV